MACDKLSNKIRVRIIGREMYQAGLELNKQYDQTVFKKKQEKKWNSDLKKNTLQKSERKKSMFC